MAEGERSSQQIGFADRTNETCSEEKEFDPNDDVRISTFEVLPSSEFWIANYFGDFKVILLERKRIEIRKR